MTKKTTLLKVIIFVFTLVCFAENGITQVSPGYTEIPFEEPFINTPVDVCLEFLHLPRRLQKVTEFVIKTQDEYQSLLRFKTQFDFVECKNFTLPEIDFSQKTLLGMYADGGGCDIEFEKKVFRDDRKKEYRYIVTIIETGTCLKMGLSMNWITVPKIPDDYKVVFETKKIEKDKEIRTFYPLDR